MKQNPAPYYFFVFSLFLVIISPDLLSRGMFSDGLQYAAVSRNLALGKGDFWNLHLANFLYPHFHEHPPLAFYLQSLWFKIFGDSLYVERGYSFFALLLSATIIVFIWKNITNNIRYGWLPLLFFISVPKISWSFANNMLENTMMVFVLLSALFYLKSLKHYRILFLILSGLSLCAAMFSKGFTSLYIWTLPFWISVFVKKTNIKRMISDTLILIFTTLLPVVLLMLFSQKANYSLTAYFNRQIIGSLKNIQTVDSRFNILLDFIMGIIIPVIIAGIIFIISRGKTKFSNEKKYLPWIKVFIALSLSGVIPITISLKQSSFYILTVYPFFTISLSLLILPTVKDLLFSLENRRKFQKRFPYFAYLFFLSGILFSYFQIYGNGRDGDIINDIKTTIEYTGKDKNIGINPSLYNNWTLHGYFARYGNISLDPDNRYKHKFFLSTNKINDSLFQKYFEISPLKTKTFIIYQRRERHSLSPNM